MPGGSGILDEENKATQELMQPSRQSELEKIKDVEHYDPHSLDDKVLRDDFRIVLAWYATWRKNPDTFSYPETTLQELLRKILVEAKRRGPDFITFHPSTMDDDVKGFFQTVAREVGVPPEQIEKRSELTRDSDPEEMTLDELKQAHWDLHLMFRKKAVAPEAVNRWSVEDLVNLHARIADELFDRDIRHPAPPDDGLDDSSSTFESNAEQQPDWTKVEKRYQPICHSGNEMGDEITLEEILKYFDTFKLRKPYIYLVGGLANHGKTKGDIDILVKDSPDMPEAFKHALLFRLGRAMPGELAKRLQVHYDTFHGPFTNFVELFDLTFERVNPKNEVKLMRDAPPPVDAEEETGDDVQLEEMLDERSLTYKECAKDFEPDED
jgi:hypothetical protein